MSYTTIRFTSFPLTEPPPTFVVDIVEVFKQSETAIATALLQKGLVSNEVLKLLAPGLKSLGFEIEAGKGAGQRIHRPVFFGENGRPQLRYEIDAFHSGWKCGLEVEAGRAWKGNAVYRDLVQALVMVDLERLVLAVPNRYKYVSLGKAIVSTDYENALAVATAIFGHTRVRLPYQLTVIGY